MITCTTETSHRIHAEDNRMCDLRYCKRCLQNVHVRATVYRCVEKMLMDYSVYVSDRRGCTHRHLHLELILVQLEEDVGERAVQEGGGPQNQNQLEVPWEGALQTEHRRSLLM